MSRARNFRETVRSGLLDRSLGRLRGLCRCRRLPTPPRFPPRSFSCRTRLAATFMTPLVLVLLSALTASAASITLALTWNPPSEVAVEGYKVFCRHEGESYNYSQPVWQGSTATCTIPNLPNITTHFVVRTCTTHGESGDSQEETYQPGLDLPLEVGRVVADHNWRRVTFRDPFADPIVVAGMVTTNDSAPAVVRIRNLDAGGFDVRIQEWDYLNGVHAAETVGYLVAERGSYVLPDGKRVEAGRFMTNRTGSFVAMQFNQPFPQAPVVLATVVSANEDDTVTTRVRRISTDGYEFRMQEQQRNTQSHATETICYLAWEPSSGSLNGMPFETGRTPNAVTQSYYTMSFRQSFADPPVLISGMQTTDSADTAAVRCRGLDRFDVDARIQEEQSGDSETSHTTEVVGYVAVQEP